MRATNLKHNESNELADLTVAFLARGGHIQTVASDVYKREDITLRDRRTILETSNSKLKAKKKSGDAQRAIDRVTFKARQIKEGKL
jgi:hypothetical protein